MSTAIFVLGTPLAAWEPLACALGEPDGEWSHLNAELSHWLDRVLGNDPTQWAQLAADEERWSNASGDLPSGGLDARLCWALEAVAKKIPNSKYLVFVDPPVRALAHWIAGSGAGGVEHALDTWCAGAQRLLRHAHRYPQRVLMVASDEMAASPQALGSLLKARLGLAPGTLGNVHALSGPDPMALALASALVAGRPGALGLHEELLATCLPLAEGAVAASSASGTWRDDVVRLYREAQQARDQARVAFDRERANACELLLRVHAAEETIEAKSVAERERSAQLARVQGRESHLRNELAQVVRGRDRQLAELRRDLRLHEEKLAQATAELAERTRQGRNREVALQRETEAKVKAEQELAAARERLVKALTQETAHSAGELTLQNQLLQLQEQLRSHHVELAKIRWGGAASSFSYHSVTFGAVLERPPHHHMDAEVHRPKWPGRAHARISVRLVEHNGQPGLAFFEEEGQRPISGWQASGQEGGRDFMLTIPQNAACVRTLEKLGSADWILLTGTVQMLEVELGNKPFAAAPYWCSVATRLRLLLADLPARLRYDVVALCPAQMPDGQLAIDVRIDDAIFGNQGLGSVCLRWMPERARAAHSPLRWLLPASDAPKPVIAHWPLEESGHAAGELVIPVGAGLNAASKRAAWAAFSAQEQGILLGLLDAMSAFAGTASAQMLPPGWDAKRLAAAAQELREDGHRSARSVRTRQLVRRLVGRAA